MARGFDRLFVYGTLLTASGHPLSDLLRTGARLIGSGSIQARLYIISEIDEQGPNSYPGAVPSPHADHRVWGEVHDVLTPDPLFAAFDEYEACTPGWPEPYEFLLRPVDVTLEDGSTVRAGSYLYTWDTSRAEAVPSGRFTGVAAGTR